MNTKPTLLILAAGMGSRYGGLKQLDHVGPSGETIIDYSVYDAVRAGFGKVVFVIKEAIEKEFREAFIDRLKGEIPMDYVFQEIWMVPGGIKVPGNRSKPWGTGHAVMVAEEKVSGPFAVINADDFYGRGAFVAVAEYYRGWTKKRDTDYCMVGYPLANTLSEFGAVSRGICRLGPDARLTGVTERTHIVREGDRIRFRDENEQMVPIDGDSTVSMNFWGFTPSFFGFLKKEFDAFIGRNAGDPKAEFYIPGVVNNLAGSGRASVKVLQAGGQWFGMTYREDRERVMQSIRMLVEHGEYPENLWG
jgi:hypothetical protein